MELAQIAAGTLRADTIAAIAQKLDRFDSEGICAVA
jgi:hypothetical protein